MSTQIADAFSYLGANWNEVQALLLQHLWISATALAIALLIALPLGIALARYRWLTTPVLSVLSTFYTIPSLALLIILIPLVGLGFKNAVITLIVYAQIILVRNIVVGVQSIDPALLEAAKGMGMNGWQRWWRVEFPLALPIILAGVRIAAVVVIGIAAIAAKINAGGLGDLLFRGIALLRDDMIWGGAIMVGLLAIVVNTLLLVLEKSLDPATRIRRAERRQATQTVDTPPLTPVQH